MPIAEKMVKFVEGSSMIRKMFEEGIRLKKEHGNDKVCDFSLGNPDVAPPKEFKDVLKKLVADDTLKHGYMPNPGYPHVREIMAKTIGKEKGISLGFENIIMCSGAAGALNTIFKALINLGEEIVVPAPYFVGYDQYAFNAHAIIKTAQTDTHFHLDMNSIESVLTEKTRVVIINSPHNPTGTVYSIDELRSLGKVLEEASIRFGKRIYLISDEPYCKIAYNVDVPSVFDVYPHTIVLTSFSKELSLAGERIGYLAVHPDAEDATLILKAAAVANTMLYVNAPSLMQLAVASIPGITVDVSIYQRRRDTLCRGLKEAGYEFDIPQGAFYLFPKSPIADDVEFARILKNELILVTPGTAFAAPGYFRISYAVPDYFIEASIGGFKKAFENVRMKKYL